jgi:hypothetical protein
MKSPRTLPIKEAVESFDFLFGEGAFPEAVEKTVAHVARVKEAINFRIDNVTEYVFVGTPQEHWDIEDDFPNLAPPAPVMWFETNGPSGLTTSDPPEVTMLTGLSLDEIRAEYKQLNAPHRMGWGILALSTDHGDDAPDGYRWETEMVLWRRTDDIVAGPDATLRYRVRPDGRAIRESARIGVMLSVADQFRRHQPNLSNQDLANLMSGSFFPAQLAICFMHCRNVATVERWPERAERRRREREDKPVHKHYTLEIEPMKTVIRTKGRSDDVGVQRALHIVRGHFKTYAPERPLFGRYAGTFWSPMHARGTAKAGTIKKDYAVSFDSKETTPMEGE